MYEEVDVGSNPFALDVADKLTKQAVSEGADVSSRCNGNKHATNGISAGVAVDLQVSDA